MASISYVRVELLNKQNKPFKKKNGIVIGIENENYFISLIIKYDETKFPFGVYVKVCIDGTFFCGGKVENNCLKLIRGMNDGVNGYNFKFEKPTISNKSNITGKSELGKINFKFYKYITSTYIINHNSNQSIILPKKYNYLVLQDDLQKFYEKPGLGTKFSEEPIIKKVSDRIGYQIYKDDVIYETEIYYNTEQNLKLLYPDTNYDDNNSTESKKRSREDENIDKYLYKMVKKEDKPKITKIVKKQEDKPVITGVTYTL